MIKDLLWACVICGRPESLRLSDDGTEVCSGCGARYRRGRGASIIVTEQGRAPVEMSAREWSNLLQPPALAGSAACTIRIAAGDYRPIRAYGKYMGRHEHFGDPIHGTLTVDDQRIRFEGAVALDWSLLDLTAIQLSSSTLQLKARRQPLITIRFDTSSPRLWEERLQRAVQAAYHRIGKGDVVEFQPRIVTR